MFESKWEIFECALRCKEPHPYVPHQCLGANSSIERCYIHSIRRSSDGLVLKIGTSFKAMCDKAFGIEGKILCITLSDSHRLFVQLETHVHIVYEVCDLSDIQLLPDNKVLFTTEDGVPVHEGIKVCLVSTTNWAKVDTIVPPDGKPFTGVTGSEFKYFSTREAADEYIVMNKPCLSLKDLRDNWHSSEEIKSQNLAHSRQFYINDLENRNPLFQRFKEIVKSKLKL